MLGKATLRRVENHIFLMNFGGAGAGKARSNALQSALKRAHIANLQLNFSLSRHSVYHIPPRAAFSRRNLTIV
jgi:hypothetical protein